MASNDHAILVGISNYPALGNLGGPTYDVIDFRDWLVSPDGGQVPSNNITLIISPDNPSWSSFLDATPQDRDVDRAFSELYIKGLNENGRVGRRLYIYMAGHGFAPEVKDAALLMANAARGLTGYHISGRPYAEWFERSRFFDEVVLFMDCCREDCSRAPVREPPFETITNAAGVARYFYGLAAEWSRSAREKPIGAGNGMRGIFTASLLAGLRMASPNEQGNITGACLEKFVFNYMHKLAEEDDERQEPKFFYHTDQDVVFKTGVENTLFTVQLTLSPNNLGKTPRLFDGTLKELVNAEVHTNLWIWKGLTSGMYKVEVPGMPAQYLEVLGEERVRNVTI